MNFIRLKLYYLIRLNYKQRQNRYSYLSSSLFYLSISVLCKPKLLCTRRTTRTKIKNNLSVAVAFIIMLIFLVSCLYVLSTVQCYPLRFPPKHDVWLFTSSCLLEVSCLINVICVYLQQWCPTHIVLCFCLVFLRLVFTILLVSLDCPILIALSVFSNVLFKQ